MEACASASVLSNSSAFRAAALALGNASRGARRLYQPRKIQASAIPTQARE